MANNGILVDAGPLVALLNRRDQHHAICVSASRTLRGPFYTCWPVITEAAYLLRENAVAVKKLLGRIRLGKIGVLQLLPEDMEGVAAILDKYSDQKLDFADAALMHLAERESIASIFTVDQRHFSLFRTIQGNSLTIVPARQ